MDKLALAIRKENYSLGIRIEEKKKGKKKKMQMSLKLEHAMELRDEVSRIIEEIKKEIMEEGK